MAAHQALEALVDAMPPQRSLEVLRMKLPSAEAVHRWAHPQLYWCSLSRPTACSASRLWQLSTQRRRLGNADPPSCRCHPSFHASNHASGTAVDGDVLCAAIRCVQRAAARLPAGELMALAPGALLPGLFAAFQHPRPDVRKVVVFCLVEMWLQIGDRCAAQRRARVSLSLAAGASCA